MSCIKKQDTVIDAGMYDGALGIICAISALKVLKVTGKLQRLTRPVEVRQFSSVSSLIVWLLCYQDSVLVSLQLASWLRGHYLIAHRCTMTHMRRTNTTPICTELVLVFCVFNFTTSECFNFLLFTSCFQSA